MDRTLRFSLIAGALFAGFGVFYHFVIYVPAKDQARKDDYAECTAAVSENYEAGWAAGCKTSAASTAERVEWCRKMGSSAAACKSLLGKADPSPDCALPQEMGASINQERKEALDRCESEARLGL